MTSQLLHSDFLIFEENLIFFFISVAGQESRRNTPPPLPFPTTPYFFQLIGRHISNNKNNTAFFYWSINVPLTGPLPVGGKEPVWPLGEVPYVGYPAHLLVQAQQCRRISIHLRGGRGCANVTSPVDVILRIAEKELYPSLNRPIDMA